MLENLGTQNFTYKKLTEEEQNKRGILGRLVGVIADFTNPTRNGRLYSEELWDKVFSDPIMQEKIQNRCVFGELGHPADREETLIENAAICLAEQPKKKDGLLYGVFDILNTPNGRILKALCDYGTTIGVSSRGTGDVEEDYDGTSKVTPDSYQCECWDAVITPSVKAARVSLVNESLEKTRYNKTLRQKLTEELNKASEDDKMIMKETLNNLNITLEEGHEIVNDKALDAVKDDFVPPMAEETDGEKVLFQCADCGYEEMIDPDKADYKCPKCGEHHGFAPVEESVEIPVEEETPVEEIVEEITTEEVVEDLPSDVPDVNESISESCGDKEEDNVVEDTIETEDNGSDDIVEQLQDALKAKKELEEEVMNLQNAKAISDTKADDLTEELNRYKKATIKLSTLAKDSKAAERKVSELSEQLKIQEKEFKARVSRKLNEDLKVRNNTKKLEESLKVKESEIKSLTEQLNDAKANLELKRSTYNKRITEAKEIISKYKTLAEDSVNHYIDSKALMMGITSNEIKNRLSESYSIDDIDKICDDLQSYELNLSRLPFDLKQSRVRFTESKNDSLRVKSPMDDCVDDDLYELAGLKR